jgi:hypothetical protein
MRVSTNLYKTASWLGLITANAVSSLPMNARTSCLFSLNGGRLRLKCDGTHTETRFRLSAKRTSPFKSAGASVQSTTAGELCISACRVCTARASLCSAVM